MEKIVNVTLLCTSDVHGHYMPWDYSKDVEDKRGGLSRVSTVVNNLRKMNKNIMLIDNGDLIQGNSAENFINSKKHPGIEVLNAMKYEIYNMGNHEFNFGIPALIKIVDKFNGIPMMGNLYRKKHKMRFMNGVFYKYIDGIKIGFISLNTPLVRKFEAKRGNLDNFDVIEADFELEKLLNEVEDVDALIGLFHMGDFNENDIPNTGVEDLLENVPNAYKIDAIFGGHMHQMINKSINSIPFLEPGAYASAISRLDLTFDKTKKVKLMKIEPSIIEINDGIESDLDIEKLLLPYHNELRAISNELVGYTNEELTPKSRIMNFPEVQISQTKLSDFYIEVMLHYSKADVVAVHFDNPFPIIEKGEILRKHIYNSYNYAGGEISNYEITGKELKQYMEWSAGYFNKSINGDINISFNPERTKFKYSTFDIFGNIKYEIDLTEDEGSRIKNLRRMNDSLISDEDSLVIGMNKYRMDYITSDLGPLKGVKKNSIWSSMSDKGLEIRGTIRNLAIKYLNDIKNKTYIPQNIERWYIKTAITDELKKNLAVNMINFNILDLYKTEKGDVDLTKSLNIKDKVSKRQLYQIRETFYDIGESLVLDDILEEILERYE